MRASEWRPTLSSLYGLANALGVRIDSFFPSSSTAVPGPVDGSLPGDDGRDRSTAEPEADSPVSHAETTVHEAWTNLVGDGQASATENPLVTSVVRVPCRKRLILEGFGGEIITELLTAEPERTAEFTLGTYMPGSHSCRPPSLLRHSGREYLLVLEGVLTVNVGYQQVVLEAGDSMAFHSSAPHRYQNDGPVPARGVWFVQYGDGGDSS